MNEVEPESSLKFNWLKKASRTTSEGQSARWWSVRDSNPWPPTCEAGALPAELTPHQEMMRQGLLTRNHLSPFPLNPATPNSIFCHILSKFHPNSAYFISVWLALFQFPFLCSPFLGFDMEQQSNLEIKKSSELFSEDNIYKMVERRRIELLTPCVQSRCSPSWANTPHISQKNGGPEWTRTSDLILIRDAL